MLEKKKPTVLVQWYPMPDVEGKENLSKETEQDLLPSKWKKKVEGYGGWILKSMLEMLRRMTRKSRVIVISELRCRHQQIITGGRCGGRTI